MASSSFYAVESFFTPKLGSSCNSSGSHEVVVRPQCQILSAGVPVSLHRRLPPPARHSGVRSDMRLTKALQRASITQDGSKQVWALTWRSAKNRAKSDLGLRAETVRRSDEWHWRPRFGVPMAHAALLVDTLSNSFYHMGQSTEAGSMI